MIIMSDSVTDWSITIANHFKLNNDINNQIIIDRNKEKISLNQRASDNEISEIEKYDNLEGEFKSAYQTAMNEDHISQIYHFFDSINY